MWQQRFMFIAVLKNLNLNSKYKVAFAAYTFESALKLADTAIQNARERDVVLELVSLTSTGVEVEAVEL